MIHVTVKLFAQLRDRLPAGAEGNQRLELPEGSTLEGLLAHLAIPAAQAAILTVNGRNTLKLATPLTEGDNVSIFPPIAGGSGEVAELVECEPQPECLSLDPSTRVKTHIVRAHGSDGSVLWERSLYSQYDSRDLRNVAGAVILAYDDRVLILDPATGAERQAYRIYLFDYFEDIAGSRTLVKEKGSALLFGPSGELLWEHSRQEILSGLLVHGEHIFLHFWGGSEVAGIRVPFTCLRLDTGAEDLAGPATAPDFAELSRPDDIVGPRQKDGRPELAQGAERLAQAHPSAWTTAMWEHVRGVA